MRETSERSAQAERFNIELEAEVEKLKVKGMLKEEQLAKMEKKIAEEEDGMQQPNANLTGEKEQLYRRAYLGGGGHRGEE